MQAISIIIPVYNTEKYIVECLNSVCTQNFQDIEIICVNDGSPDNSAYILNSYAQKDYRIKVITQENKGLGPARNTGMLHARGKYIFFLASDDILMPNALAALYDNAIQSGADVIIGQAHAFADKPQDKLLQERTRNNNTYFGQDHVKQVLQITQDSFSQSLVKIPCVAWGRLYSKHFLEKNRLFFIDKNIIHEDNGFYIKLLSCFPSICNTDVNTVHYRIREASLMSVAENKLFKEKRIENLRIVVEDAFCFIKASFDAERAENIIKQVQTAEGYRNAFGFQERIVIRCYKKLQHIWNIFKKILSVTWIYR